MTSDVLACQIERPQISGRRDRRGLLLIAGSLLMTFASCGAALVDSYAPWGLEHEQWLLIPMAAWALVEHVLWLGGIVLLTRRGWRKRVGPVGWIARVAAFVNIAGVLGVAGCAAFIAVSDDLGGTIVAVAAAIAGAAGNVLCRMAAAGCLATVLLRWGHATKHGRRLVNVMIAWWLLVVVAGGLGVTALGSGFIAEAGTVALWVAAIAGMMGLLGSAGILTGLYAACPTMLDDGEARAFPVELADKGA